MEIVQVVLAVIPPCRNIHFPWEKVGSHECRNYKVMRSDEVEYYASRRGSKIYNNIDDKAMSAGPFAKSCT